MNIEPPPAFNPTASAPNQQAVFSRSPKRRFVVRDQPRLSHFTESEQQEIVAFSTYLGCPDLLKHMDLLPIVLEALNTRPPANWNEYTDDSSQSVYFHNTQLNISIWEHPCDEFYKSLIKKRLKPEKSCACGIL